MNWTFQEMKQDDKDDSYERKEECENKNCDK
jgi:hypothetical protein